MHLNNPIVHPDVVVLYQDHDVIDTFLDPIIELNVSFKAIDISEKTLSLLTQIKPKVILFAFNHVNKAIEYYVHCLEHLNQQESSHYAVLMVSNREAQRAYLACENGLFDNFVVINPFNERYRINLIVLQALKLINERRDDVVKKLIQQGEDKLATCIEKGSQLKQQLSDKLTQYKLELEQAAQQENKLKEEASLIKLLTEQIFNQLRTEFAKQMDGMTKQLGDIDAIQKSVIKQLTPKSDTLDDFLSETEDHLMPDSTEEISEEIENSHNQKFSILIAESSVLFSKVVADIFRDENFKVYVTQDGIETLSLAAKHKPDAIIISYDLYKLNGIEVTKRLRNSNYAKNTPIIALSNITEKKLIRRWIPQGLNAYLVKPSTNNTILSTVMHELTHPSTFLHASNQTDDIHIAWHPEYTVGNKKMDEHHQQLFCIINEYFHTDYTNSEALHSIFTKLFDYVKFHFIAEEQLLADNLYPKLEQHKHYHAVFLDKLQLLKNKLDERNIDVINKIGMFLYKWLTKHILNADMAYKHFFDIEKNDNTEI
jgi:hemerythrin-like metal-binding protein